MDDLDREFALLAASAERTASVQRAEVERCFVFGPRSTRTLHSGQRTPAVSGIAANELKIESARFRGSALGRHLIAAYDAVISHVKQRQADYETLPDDEAKGGAVIEMRQIVLGARNLHRSLAWMDAASEPHLDLGTRYLVDYLAATLVAPEADVTVVVGERSYGKVTNPLSPVFNLSGAVLATGELAIVIFVPRREQRSGLLHGLIVHELAHAADDRHDMVGEILEHASTDSDITSGITAAVDDRVGDDSVDEAGALESLIRRLRAWTEEAFATR